MNNELISREALKKDYALMMWKEHNPYDSVNVCDVVNQTLDLIDDAKPALFPLTVRVVDKVTDEDIETLKRLMKDYHPQILNLENEWIPITFRQADDEEYEAIRAVYRSYYSDIPREEAKVYDCRMPDDKQEVLITTSWSEVCEDTFHADAVLSGFEYHDDPDNVIAWMPKPKPYKKKGEEE